MNWLAKAFSKLAHVSVRTLHHYDDIGLLKPSLRSSGNYRLYSEDDLFRLQCITALKSFGFDLEQIKILLDSHVDMTSQLEAQKRCLEQQVSQLGQTVSTINRLIVQAQQHGGLAWTEVVSLFEAYRMSDYLSQAWVGRVFSQDQIEQFRQLGERLSPAEMKDYQNRWSMLIAKINKRLEHGDISPKSAEAIALAREFEAMVDEMYAQTPELKDALTLAYKHNKLPHMPFDRRLWDFIVTAHEHDTGKK